MEITFTKKGKELASDLINLKTSAEWLMTDGYDHFTVTEPTGWDSNLDFSFFKEKISEAEFYKRVMNSTILVKEHYED